MSRRNLLALGAGAASLGMIRAAEARQHRSVVVELFTSQACSSCPPADEFLAEIRTMRGVVAVTYHVDYWDYLGWRDTLGWPAFSRRQYDYARARNDMDVYTPQMIIDGGKQYVGSKRHAVLDAIERAREAPAGVPLSLAESGGDFVVEIGDGEPDGEAIAWMIPIIPETKVKILKGEAAGQEVDYHNVSRDLIPMGSWSGGHATLSIAKAAVLGSCCKGCVVLLQKGRVGPVLGVATWGEISA